MNPGAEVLAVDEGTPIAFVASFSDNGVQGSAWGPKSAGDTVSDVTQFLVWDETADKAVRVQRDGRGLPQTVIDEVNGAFIVALWEASRATFKFYQPDGSYIGGCEVLGAAPNYTIRQLADAKVVGYFSGTLSNANGGIFALTVGGREAAPPAKPKSARGTRNLEAKAPDLPTAKKLVNSMVAALGDSDYPVFAKRLLQELVSQFRSSGQSGIWQRILDTALNNTGLTGFFRDGAGTVLRGLLITFLAKDIVDFYAQGLSANEQRPGLTYPGSSPGLTGYIARNALSKPNEATDRTGVVGVMLAREFGTVPVYGYIDGSGRVSVSGSGQGALTTLEGTITGDTFAGTWNSTQSNRGAAGNGNASGQRQPLGQCSAVQNSGGQGTFTNAYDLGKCGKFPFSYDAYTIPDHFIVVNDSRTIFDTGGLVSGGATVQLGVSGNSTVVQVTVEAPQDGTLWEYTVGCP